MRLLHKGVWFDAIDPASNPEWSFEQMLLAHSDLLFPSFLVAEFKKRLPSRFGNVEADLVLIERQYRTWHLVEVERADHSLYGHVVPQVERLVSAKIDRRLAAAVAEAVEEADPVRTAALVEDVPHSTTVVVNSSVPEWQAPIQNFGANLAVVEVFRNQLQQSIFRVNGHQPEGLGDVLTTLEPGKNWFQQAFLVATPTALQETIPLLVRTDLGLETWRAKRISTSLYLFPPAGRSAADYGSCELVKDSDDSLLLRKRKVR